VSKERSAEALAVIKPYIEGNVATLTTTLIEWKELLKRSENIELKAIPDPKQPGKFLPETETYLTSDIKNLELFQDEITVSITLGEKFVALADRPLDLESSVILMARIEDLFNKNIRFPRLKLPGLILTNHSFPWLFPEKVFMGINFSKETISADTILRNSSFEHQVVSKDFLIVTESVRIIYLSHDLSYRKTIIINEKYEKIEKMLIDFWEQIWLLVSYIYGNIRLRRLVLINKNDEIIEITGFGTQIVDFAIVGEGKDLGLINRFSRGYTLRSFSLETMSLTSDMFLEELGAMSHIFPDDKNSFIIQRVGLRKGITKYTVETTEILSNVDFANGFVYTPLFYIGGRTYTWNTPGVPNCYKLPLRDSINSVVSPPCHLPDGSFLHIYKTEGGKIFAEKITTV
jgi:hypothetical protein